MRTVAARHSTAQCLNRLPDTGAAVDPPGATISKVICRVAKNPDDVTGMGCAVVIENPFTTLSSKGPVLASLLRSRSKSKLTHRFWLKPVLRSFDSIERHLACAAV